MIKSPTAKFSSKIAQEMQFLKSLNLDSLIRLPKLNTPDSSSKMAQKDITTLVLQNHFFTQMHEALGFLEIIFMPAFSKMTQVCDLCVCVCVCVY